MARVISMREYLERKDYRERRNPGLAQLSRLERTVQRLESSLRGAPGGLAPAVERELLWIVRAMSAGRTSEAADRAERLAGLLGHPAAARS
jgi:hypothetical protein